MPELPELIVWARQAREELVGRTISEVEVVQPKCLNVAPQEMASFLNGRSISEARERGKWLFLDLEPGGHLLLNLGMGGDFHYEPGPGGCRAGVARERNDGFPDPTGQSAPPAGPEKHQFGLAFADGGRLALRFWWFGYVHLARDGELDRHTMTAGLGPSPLDPALTLERFRTMVAARPRRGVKSFLMAQKIIAGIGNVYVQDILWSARLHPDLRLGSLSESQVETLWRSMRDHLYASAAKGGLAYERDLYGRAGGFGREHFAVAYKTGEPCPRCQTPVEKIKTGATSSYICPQCQQKG